jgi:predicted  nucleic acid-binding Zn-ribbon protein
MNHLYKYPVLFFAAGVLFASCSGNKEGIKKLMIEKDSLVTELAMRDTTIGHYVGSFTDIESNLASIREMQSAIALNSTGGQDIKPDSREKINEDIKAINSLMSENMKMISALNTQVSASGKKITSLNKLVESLNVQLADKQSELDGLQEEMARKNLQVETLYTEVDTLNARNASQSNVISDQQTKLNTAFYVIGTYKTLKAHNVLNKEGGFLGMGKEQEIKKDFNADYFTKLDISQTKSLAVTAKSAKLLSTHPSDSYHFDQDDKGRVTTLTILDAERFWKDSKYLVIVTVE